MLANFAAAVMGKKSEEPKTEIDLDKGQFDVPVWTMKNSGYFYCSDSQYYKTLQPGTLTTQLDAMQSGYQPEFGEFCE